MNEPERRTADGSMVGRTCPYCRFPLKEGGDVMVCGECHAAHHYDCWTDNSGCAVLGCTAAPAADTGTHATATQQMPPVSPPLGTAGTGKLKVGPDDWPTESIPQSPPPPPSGPDPRRRSPRAIGLSFAVVLLALALGGVAAALLVTKSKKRSITVTQVSQTTVTTPDSSTSDSTTQTSSTDQGSSSDVSSTTDSFSTTTSSTPPPPTDGGAVAALKNYWNLVNTGAYDQAYAMETSVEQNAESNFVQDKQSEQPKIVLASVGQPTFPNGHEADVSVDMWTQDRNSDPGVSDTTCREFTGTAVMIKSGSSWLYSYPQYNQPTSHPGISYPDCRP